MGNEIRLANRSLTLRLKRDAFIGHVDRQRVAQAAELFLNDAFIWTRDSKLMTQLCSLLRIGDATSPNAVFKVRRAIETGELVTIPDAPRNTGAGGRGNDGPKPPSITFTPSQLFRGAARIAGVGSYIRPKLPRLRAEDGIEIWNANPGDVLPDGSIATAFTDFNDAADAVADDTTDSGALLDGAQSFELADSISGDDAVTMAAQGVSEEQEVGCFAEYERALDLCNALSSAMGGSRGAALCRQNAFDNYQQCRGY